MSPSSAHSGEHRRARSVKHCSMASAQERSFRNPYEFRSPVTSATGSSAISHTACCARSSIVGMPSGRNLPFFFGM